VDRLRNIFACTNWLDIAQDLVVMSAWARGRRRDGL